MLLLYQAFLLVALILILWKGGKPERIGALVIAAMAVWQLGADAFIPSRFDDLDTDSLVSDLIGFAGFGYLALHARRIWPIVATSLQMLCVYAHLIRFASSGLEPMVYAVARGVPTGIAVLLMLAGTILHMQARRRGEVDPPWQDWKAIRAERKYMNLKRKHDSRLE